VPGRDHVKFRRVPWRRLPPTVHRLAATLADRGYLRRLAEVTGESANLAVLSSGRAEYVSRALGRHTMRIFTEVGNRVSLHCTGVGKAILAVVPPARASALIAADPLTAHTHTSDLASQRG